MHRLVLSSLVAVVALGCGPSWQVIRQATPDPFAGAKKFAVAVDLSKMRIDGKPEAAYKAQGADEAARWDSVRESFETNFLETFKASAAAASYDLVDAGAPFKIRVVLEDLDLGYYVGISSGASLTPIAVQLTGPDGAVLDELTTMSRTRGNVINPTPAARIRNDAQVLAKRLVSYLDQRTKDAK